MMCKIEPTLTFNNIYNITMRATSIVSNVITLLPVVNNAKYVSFLIFLHYKKK